MIQIYLLQLFTFSDPFCALVSHLHSNNQSSFPRIIAIDCILLDYDWSLTAFVVNELILVQELPFGLTQWESSKPVATTR